jgi:hypothetical protein
MTKRLGILVIIFVLLTTIWVASFIQPTTAQTTVQSLLGELRAVNGLVGLGPVDVYLNETLLAYNLSPEAATTYFSVLPGRYSMAVRPAGANAFSAPIADMLIDVATGQNVTAIAYQKQFANEDYIPPYEQAGAIYVVEDDRSPIELGKTRLTAVHLAVGAPDSISIAYPRTSLLDSIRQEQPFGGIDTNAGLFSLTLVDATTTSENVLERFGDQSFYGNTLYTLVIVPNTTYTYSERDNRPLVGQSTAVPHMFVVSAPVQPSNNGMRLRLINAAFGVPTVDVYIDGQLTAARMNYSGFSEYLGLPSYSHQVTLRRAGASREAPPLAETTISIPTDTQPQQDWTLLMLNGSVVNQSALGQAQATDTGLPTITNLPNSPIMMTLLPDNLSQTATNQARLRLLHAVDNLPPISLSSPDTVLYDPMPGVVATPTLTPTLNPLLSTSQRLVSLVNRSLFGATAGETEVRTGIYDALNLQLVGNQNDFQTLPTVHFVPGLIYTYIVIGNPSGNPPIQVIPVTDFGRGLPFFRPGQLPTPTSAPMVVTRIPQTPTPGDLPVVVVSPTVVQSSGVNGGGSSGGGSGGGGGQATLPPSVPTFTPRPPTQPPPTQQPPTNPPPTDPPPPPTDPPPPPTDPPPPPTDDPGIIPPIIETILPPLGDILDGLGGG